MRGNLNKNRTVLASIAIAFVLALGLGLYLKKRSNRGKEPTTPIQSKPEAVPLPEPAPPLPTTATEPTEKVVLPPAPAEKSEFGSRMLRRGMTGEDVKILQERLRLAGFIRYNFQEGCFDEATENALVEYQRGTRFLREMYAFPGIPGEPKNYADAELCRQLFEVPGRNKALVKYTIKKGDSLWRIASRFGVGPDSLTTLNQISSPAVLKPGNTIFIICNADKAK